jgi:hypothetical protein
VNWPVIVLYKWEEGNGCRLRHTPNLTILNPEDGGNIILRNKDTHPQTTQCHKWEQQNMKLKCCEILDVINYLGGWDSVVCIATRYALDGLGIESRWRRDFPQQSRPALGPTQPPAQWVLVLFPRGKAARAWSWPPTPSSFRVKERVKLYLYSPSGPSLPVLGRTLPINYLKSEYSNFLTCQVIHKNSRLMKVCALCT